jgi:hypothetical protein
MEKEDKRLGYMEMVRKKEKKEEGRRKKEEGRKKKEGSRGRKRREYVTRTLIQRKEERKLYGCYKEIQRKSECV